MGVTEKVMQRMGGAALGKNLEGLKKVLESLHAHIELQTKIQEEIFKEVMRANGNKKEVATKVLEEIRNSVLD